MKDDTILIGCSIALLRNSQLKQQYRIAKKSVLVIKGVCKSFGGQVVKKTKPLTLFTWNKQHLLLEILRTPFWGGGHQRPT